MAIPIFPVEAIRRPLESQFEIQTVINSFGYPYEQRIVTSLPYGPRESGWGTQRTYIGRSRFAVGIQHMRMRSQLVPGNANLNNGFEKLWEFYQDRFYNQTTRQIKYEAFYWYDPLVNDQKTTWTGDTSSNGFNSRMEAVTNVTGRYLVRFAESNLSRSCFRSCLVDMRLEFVEVAA